MAKGKSIKRGMRPLDKGKQFAPRGPAVTKAPKLPVFPRGRVKGGGKGQRGR